LAETHWHESCAGKHATGGIPSLEATFLRQERTMEKLKQSSGQPSPWG
jgi:hypothetical protein